MPCQYLSCYVVVLDVLVVPGNAMGFGCWANRSLISTAILISFVMKRRLVIVGWWWVSVLMLLGGCGGSDGCSPDDWIWRCELLSVVVDQRRCLWQWVRVASFGKLDVMVHEGAREADVTWHELTWDIWHRSLRTNIPSSTSCLFYILKSKSTKGTVWHL